MISFEGIEREIGSLQLEVLECTFRTFCTSWQPLLCTLLILRLSAGFCEIHPYIVRFGLEKNVQLVQLACNHKSMHFVITSGVGTCRRRNLLQRSRRPQKLEMRCVLLQLEFVLDLFQYISCGHDSLRDCQPHALLHFPSYRMILVVLWNVDVAESYMGAWVLLCLPTSWLAYE